MAKRLRKFLLAIILSVVGIAAVATGALGAGCYGAPPDDNEGAWKDSSSSGNYGLKADNDFESASVANGDAIIHPMQIGFSNGEFMGWGTAKGVGVANCPDDYEGWNVYVDGWSFDHYFCRQAYGQIWPGDPPVTLKIERGCGSDGLSFEYFKGGVSKTCQNFSSTSGFVSVGAEIIGTTATQHVDVHYDNIRRLHFVVPSSTWDLMTSGGSCINSGYRIRVLDSNWNLWVEEVP